MKGKKKKNYVLFASCHLLSTGRKAVIEQTNNSFLYQISFLMKRNFDSKFHEKNNSF